MKISGRFYMVLYNFDYFSREKRFYNPVMNTTLRLKLALVGTSQLSFPGDKAGRFRKSALDLKEYLKGFNADLFIYNEMVITPDDAKASLVAVDAEKPDFLLVQCTSYSAGLLAQIYAKAGFPLGWWAIPEAKPGGVMEYNSFCSINMYQAITRNYYNEEKPVIKWFFGEVDDSLLKNRLGITVQALKAIKRLRNSKIALIGGIAPGFNDLYFDERKVLRRFPGMEYNRLPEFSEIADRVRIYKDSEVTDLAAEISGNAKDILEKAKPHHLLNAKFVKAYREFINEGKYDAIAVSCWPKFQDEFNYSICSVMGRINDEGIIASCEGDVFGAISMLMLTEIAGMPATLMDMTNFDRTDDTVLMWHCGPAAACYAKGSYNLAVNYNGTAHTPEIPLNCTGVTRDMVFKPGKATIGRIAGECDELFVASGTFIDRDKPGYFGSRGWLGDLCFAGEKTNALELVNMILTTGFAHHYPLVYGDYEAVLMEIAAWLGLKPMEKCVYREWLQVQ
jgi:L-fucose isomerase-like protein